MIQSFSVCRAFYLVLYKHMMFLEKRGCPRTALEYCKLILRYKEKSFGSGKKTRNKVRNNIFQKIRENNLELFPFKC